MNSTASGPRRRRTGAVTVPNNVYFLLGLFIVLEYTRIPSLIPILGVLRLEMFLLLLLLIAWFRYGDRNDLKNPIVRGVLAFAFLCGLGLLYTPNTRAAFNMMTSILSYLAAVILPMLAFVRTVERLKWFLQLFVLANTFIAVWAITHAGAGPGGFTTDENDCAMVLNVAMPFAVALACWPGQTRVMKYVWLGCGFLLLMGSISTLSRGGFVGIVACAATGFLYAPRKLRILGIVLGVTVVAVPLAPLLLPKTYIHEVESINDPTDSTRLNRLYFWKLGWMMYKANPIIGVGAGNYPWTVNRYERLLPPEEVYRNQYSGGRPAHSLYFTLLPELGTVGVIIFAFLVKNVIQTGTRARVRVQPAGTPPQRGPPPAPAPSADRVTLDIAGRAIVCSCIAYLSTGAFISVLYYPSFWHLAGIAAAVGSIKAALDPSTRKAPLKSFRTQRA